MASEAHWRSGKRPKIKCSVVVLLPLSVRPHAFGKAPKDQMFRGGALAAASRATNRGERVQWELLYIYTPLGVTVY